MEAQTTDFEQHQQVEIAAYYCWQARGCPMGSAEVDWFEAEEQMGSAGHDLKPGVVGVAEAVGSALGSLAGGILAVVRGLGDSEDS